MALTGLWRHSDFRKLWFGQTISNIGDKVSRIAVPSVAILVLHGDALTIGILGALRSLPFLVLSPIVGVWTDRLPRRWIMIVADAGRLIALVSIPLAYLLNSLTMIHLYAVAAAVGVLTVFFEVAYQAYLPALVGGEHVVEGNEKLQMTRSAADVGGSALGGLFMQVLGIPLAIFVDALSFVVSLAGLVTIRHREQRSDRHSKSVGPRGLTSELWEGLLVLLGDARLRALMGTMSMVNFGFAAGTALVLIFAYRDLRLTPGEVGLAFGAGGVGLIIGAVLARRVAGIFGLGPTVVLAIVVMGLGFALLPLASAGLALIVLAACQFAVGMADGILNVHIISLVQAITPAHLMGRVGGSALSVVFGVSTFGSMVGGILALAIGVKFVLLITGLFIAAGSTFVLASPIRRLAEQPTPAPSH